MVSSFDEIPDKGYLSLQIMDNSTDTATGNQQEAIEQVLLDNFEFVFAYGLGSNQTLNRSEYGYVIPDSSTWLANLTDLQAQLEAETPSNNIDINLSPLNLSKEDFDSMRQVGERQSLEGLRQFAKDLDESDEFDV